MTYTIQPFVPNSATIAPLGAYDIHEAHRQARDYVRLNPDAVCVIKDTSNPYPLTVAIVVGRAVKEAA